MSPNSILAATDGSPVCRWAVSRAASLASAHGAALHVVHVVAEGSDVDDDDQRRRLAEHVARVDPTPIVAIVPGVPFVEIIRHARSVSADLVVMGAHTGKRRRPRFVGTTVGKVLRKGECATLVVRTPVRGPYLHVVLGVDFSDGSALAARTVAALAPDADIVALHAYVVVGETKLRPADGSADQIEQLRGAAADELRPRARGFVEQLGGAIDDVVLTAGAPAAELVRVASERGSQLVAVGARGTSAAKYMLIGSVTESVARDAPCDVLVARRGRGEFELP